METDAQAESQTASSLHSAATTAVPNGVNSSATATATATATNGPVTSLTSLPSELLFQILSYLPAVDLALVSGSSRLLREHADNDHLWADLVNSNLPSPIRDPNPCPTFKSLYASHHPLWFVVRNKIWFSDVSNTGKLIIARYDHRRGSIDAYRLVARHTFRTIQHWERNNSVMVHSFDPHVGLWLDDPVVQLDRFVPSPQQNRLDWRTAEVRMPMAIESQRVFSNFILCSKMDAEAQDDVTRAVWPPPRIPAEERADTTYSKFLSFQSLDDRPQRLGDICESAFRIRRWIQFGNHLAAFDIGTVMDGISTYSTLRPDLYTPTEEKPYQGIWVGDYSAHGSEFLLVLQSDSPAPDAASMEQSIHDLTPHSRSSSNQDGDGNGSGDGDGDGDNSSNSNNDTELPSGGSLEAIKLTGDPNVPRGEVTFAADDIGQRGLIRVADEDIFKGAHVVRSRGHVAATNFRDGKQTDLPWCFDFQPGKNMTDTYVCEIKTLLYRGSYSSCRTNASRTIGKNLGILRIIDAST